MASFWLFLEFATPNTTSCLCNESSFIWNALITGSHVTYSLSIFKSLFKGHFLNETHLIAIRHPWPFLPSSFVSLELRAISILYNLFTVCIYCLLSASSYESKALWRPEYLSVLFTVTFLPQNSVWLVNICWMHEWIDCSYFWNVTGPSSFCFPGCVIIFVHCSLPLKGYFHGFPKMKVFFLQRKFIFGFCQCLWWCHLKYTAYIFLGHSSDGNLDQNPWKEPAHGYTLSRMGFSLFSQFCLAPRHLFLYSP